MTPIIVKKLKVAQWKNDFIKRPHNTVNLNFSSPKLRVRHCFGFCKGDSSVPHCKALAQLTSSYWKTEESSSFKGKQRVTGKFAVWQGFFTKPFFYWATFICIFCTWSTKIEKKQMVKLLEVQKSARQFSHSLDLRLIQLDLYL